MKILFAVDLHGAPEKYEALVREAAARDVHAVVNGGDMFPHLPDMVHGQRRFIEEEFSAHLARFDEMGIPYLFLPANDDVAANDGLLDEVAAAHSSARQIARRSASVGGWDFVGMDLVIDYPFPLKDRCRRDTAEFVFPPQMAPARLSAPAGWQPIEDWPAFARALPTLGEELDRLPAPECPARAVYVVHQPPAGLGLDVCANGARVGSAAVRRFLEERRPRLSLHGHIHESPEAGGVWQARLEETLCVQPGQGRGLTFVDIDLGTLECRRLTVRL